MRDFFHQELGQRIRSARDGKMTQDQLATQVGLSRTAITNIECGRQRLLVDQLVEIASALHVAPADLIPCRESAGRAKSHIKSDAEMADLPTVALWIRSVTHNK